MYNLIFDHVENVYYKKYNDNLCLCNLPSFCAFYKNELGKEFSKVFCVNSFKTVALKLSKEQRINYIEKHLIKENHMFFVYDISLDGRYDQKDFIGLTHPECLSIVRGVCVPLFLNESEI